MAGKILVTYASKYGSTREVAETLAAELQAGGQEVDLRPVRQVASLEPYAAVVLGMPLYIGRWHKDAQRFLARHQAALERRQAAGLPVAVFTLGPTGREEQEWQAVQVQLDQELARYPWFEPGPVALFGGRYDPAKLHFPDNLLASLPASPLHGAPASDARDWETIRAWARDLALRFQPA